MQQNQQSKKHNPLLSQGPSYLEKVETMIEKHQSTHYSPHFNHLQSFVWGYLAAVHDAGTLDFIFDKVLQVSDARQNQLIDDKDLKFILTALAKDLQYDYTKYISQKLEDPSKLPDLKTLNSQEESKLSEDLIKKLKEEEEKELEAIRKQKEEQSSVDCKICLDKLDSQECSVIDTCGHVYHKECLKNHASSRIQARSLPINCPEPKCDGEIMLADLEGLVNKDDLDKYKEFSLKNYLDTHSQEVSWCPTADCPFVFINEAKITDFTCPVCRHRYCFKCMVKFHEGQSCEEYRINNKWSKDDEKFVNLMKSRKYKQCPKCNYWIEKSQGCNSMSCRCGFTFCYACGKHPCECGGRRRRDLRRDDLVYIPEPIHPFDPVIDDLYDEENVVRIQPYPLPKPVIRPGIPKPVIKPKPFPKPRKPYYLKKQMVAYPSNSSSNAF